MIHTHYVSPLDFPQFLKYTETMNKNKHIVEIFDYSTDGAGVARLADGCVVFVDGAVRGDVCEVIIIKALKRVNYAKIERIITPSIYRIPVDCAVFGKCGGCDFRHISYEEELFAKRKKVNDALKRIGGVSIEVEDILTTGKTNGYRNNIQLKTDGEKIGFYSKSSHEIVEIEHCLLVNDEMNEKLQQGFTNIRTSVETIGDLTFKISPESFFQVNTEAALLLYEKAREYAALQPHEFLLDLYCGTGTITLFLARDVKKALGVELCAEAINDANENAIFNNISNVEFLCKNVSELETSELAPDCIIVDPPRKGLAAEVIRKIEELASPRVVYISCDPATLARDIKLLENYDVKRVCAVDMFPRTKHIEVITKLERKCSN
jgi:23S rRNA (uracil1939-C5)-methyltransferase